MLWDREHNEIVGAYRLGRADAILNERGFAGLYTNTLFEYRDGLTPIFGSALELGDLLSDPNIRRHTSPLCFWVGDRKLCRKPPPYRFLFGAVSINNEYLGVSRKLMVEFLREGHTHSDLARLVRARNSPPSKGKRKQGLAYSMVHDPQDFSELISDIERDGTGIPILLKHYMKLGGKFLGFSVDPKFNNALDALVLVDLFEPTPESWGATWDRRGWFLFGASTGPALGKAAPITTCRTISAHDLRKKLK